MSYKHIIPGKNIPDECHVVVEISANSAPVKYEVDKEMDVVMVDRVLSTAMTYPCNYGYVPQTLCDDGDPLDMLVLCDHPIAVGAVVTVRPIGMLMMTDEAGLDYKILAVPTTKISKTYAHVQTIHDLPPSQLKMLEHFFQHYKDLDDGKWVKLDGWRDAVAAKQALVDSVAMYKKQLSK